MPKIILSGPDLEKIKSAVKEAESKTAGEIAAAFIKESDNYALYELLFGIFCGFVYFILMMFFAQDIENTIRGMFWDYSSEYLPLFYGLSTFLVIFIFYFLANISIIDRLVVPKRVMQEKVNQRAVRHFMDSGVYNTRDRTGILIFISALEQRVELLADKGINEKISPEKWNDIVRHIIEGIKTNRLTDHLVNAVGECGTLLAQHFPIRPDDVNELKDDVALLEK